MTHESTYAWPVLIVALALTLPFIIPVAMFYVLVWVAKLVRRQR